MKVFLPAALLLLPSVGWAQAVEQITPGAPSPVQMNRIIEQAVRTEVVGAVTALLAGTNPTAITNLTGARINIVGDQGLTVMPTGNPGDTGASVSVQGKTNRAAQPEFLVNLGFESNRGAAHPGDAGNKVTLYTGMTCNAGSGSCWSMNPLTTANKGFEGSAQTVEADMNNFEGDAPLGRGALRTALSANGAINPGAYNTSGLLIASVNSTPIWHYGILGANKSIKDALVYDWEGNGTYSYANSSNHAGSVWVDTGTSPIGLELRGTYSNAAIDASAATGSIAIRVAGASALVANGGNGCFNIASTVATVTTVNATHCPTGSTFSNVSVTGKMAVKPRTLTSSTEPCVAGEMAADAKYVYACVSTNHWGRAALATTGW